MRLMRVRCDVKKCAGHRWSFIGGKSQIAMVAGRVARWSFIQHRQSVSEKTVVKSGWSLIRVVVHEEFYCSKNYWYLTKANNLNKHTFNTSIHCTYP